MFSIQPCTMAEDGIYEYDQKITVFSTKFCAVWFAYTIVSISLENVVIHPRL